MTTLVSAFISNINTRQDININTYYERGICLIKSKIPKIIFLDENMMELIGDNYDNTTTLLIKINPNDFYLNEYISQININNIITNFPEKDTIGYMVTMANKTEWMKTAILLNTFNTDNFIWVDFGIRYLFHCNDKEFIEKIDNLQNKYYSTIRIASIWDVHATFDIDICREVAWYFAGSVFGGHKDYLLDFSEKMKTTCIDIITNKNIFIWEVNIWYLLFKVNPEMFDCYYCDHNDSIIDNY